jgi:hypothetical protein
MMHFKAFIFFVFTCLFMISCETQNQEYTKLLIGKWNGSKWYIEGELHDYDMNRIKFEFKTGYRYTAQLGDSREVGSYRVYGKKLYTQDGAAAQIMTEIDKLTQDSLVINMNRGGQLEKLILLREN